MCITKPCGQNISKGENIQCWLDVSANSQTNQSVTELQVLLINALHRNLTGSTGLLWLSSRFPVYQEILGWSWCCLFKQEPRAPKPSPPFPCPGHASRTTSMMEIQFESGNPSREKEGLWSKGIIERDQLCLAPVQLSLESSWQRERGNRKTYTIELNNRQAHWVKNWPHLSKSLIWATVLPSSQNPPLNLTPWTEAHLIRTYRSWQGQDARAAVTGTKEWMGMNGWVLGSKQ